MDLTEGRIIKPDKRNCKMTGLTIQPIESNNNRHSCIVPMAEGAFIGGAAGYAAKYLQPLTPQEKANPEYKKVIEKINNQKTTYGPQTERYLDQMKAKDSHSLAEDVFIKMFDGMKEGDKVKGETIREAINSIREKNPNEVAEFKRVCKASTQIAEKTAKQCIDAYNLVTKHIRPTGFYITTGAVVGAIIALFKDILRPDGKNV